MSAKTALFPGTGASSVKREIAAAALVLLIGAALLPFFYVGFQASDDAGYLIGALGWLNSFPYVGDTHWTLRHTITIPVSLSIAVFGLNEVSVSIPNVIYFGLFLAVNTIVGGRILGLGASTISSLLLVTLPGFLVLSTYLVPEIPELFYVSVAFWAFVAGWRRPESLAPWIVCGVSWALAFLTRETSLVFALFLGILFLFRPLVPRSRYLLIAAGALPVLLAEWAFLFANTGDPLYRYRIDFYHGIVDRAAEHAETLARGGIIDGEGNLAVNVFIDPIINLFVSQKYGLVFWLTIFAGWQLWKNRSRLEGKQTPLALIAGLGLVSFCFVALNPRLVLVPRYLVLFAWTASLLAGFWLAMRWQAGRRGSTLAVILVAVALNLLALTVENTNPRFAERELASWVARHPDQTIHVDPETGHRSAYFFRFQSVDSRSVSMERPEPGSLVFYTPDGLRRCATSPRCKEFASSFRPTPSWREVVQVNPPERVIFRLGRLLGLQKILPPDLARRLTRPVSPVVIYRVES